MKQATIPAKIFRDPKYRGKHVVLSGNKILAFGSWEKVSRVFDETLKKTKKAPALTFIPKEGILTF